MGLTGLDGITYSTTQTTTGTKRHALFFVSILAVALALVISQALPIFSAGALSLEISQSAYTVTKVITLGGNLDAVYFDGSRLWVSDYNSTFASVLRTDGSLAYTVATGFSPKRFLAFGDRVWIATADQLTATVVQRDNGAVVMAPFVGRAGKSLATDGTNIWVSNPISGIVRVLQPNDGTEILSATVGAEQFVSNLAPGFLFDGSHFWLADQYSGFADAQTITEIDTNATIMLTATVGRGPNGIAFDGANVWVTSGVDNSVNIVRAIDGYVLLSRTVGIGPGGIAFDGVRMWVANCNEGSVAVLRASDAALLQKIRVGNCPFGITFDGANIWVANVIDGTLMQIAVQHRVYLPVLRN